MRNRLALFLILLACFGFVSVSVTYYALSPKPSQSFMGLGIYSRSSLQGYTTPISNSTVTAPQTFNWTITVSNDMGSAQFVMIIARIANSTPTSPTTTTPSALFPNVTTPEVIVGDGETSNIDFNWTLDSTNQTGVFTYLTLSVNGQQNIHTQGRSGQGFRWIFELWTYDLSTGTFHYGYGPQSSAEGVWLQIWFKPST